LAGQKQCGAGSSVLASGLLSVAPPTAHSVVPAMKLAEAEKHIGHDPFVVRGLFRLQVFGGTPRTWSLLPEDHPTKQDTETEGK